MLKHLTMAAAASAMLIMPVERATADTAGGLLGGLIIGGAIGSAIERDRQRQRRVVRERVYVPRSGISSAQRAENREVQTSLNYFGFPAGVADGVLGRRSRAAITDYQVHMGYPATGRLAPYEKDFLLTSYRRAIAGGAITSQQIAQSPLGPRGLLHTYRDQAAGITTAVTPAPTVIPQASTTTVVVTPQAVVPEAPAANAPAPTLEETTEVAAEAPQGNSLPNLFGGATQEASLASHCNQVNLLTSSNGFATSASMTDANQALNEQFCLARTYSISQGEELISKVQGFTTEQIAQQCAGFGPALKDFVSSLSLKTHDAVLQDVAGFVLDSGVAPAQLASTSKICLSVGYRTDDMNVAVGSALLLTALGEQVYGELIGHHLAQGYGVAKRVDLSLPWYDMGLKAIENGAVAVFAPGQPERNELIRKATFSLTGGVQQGAAQPGVQPTNGGGLPTFSVSE